MTENKLREVLTQVKKGSLSVDDGLKKLKHLPFEDMGFARIDHHRPLRQGFPEVIFGRGKTVRQILGIVERMLAHQHNVLITRTNAEVFRAVKKLERQAVFYSDSGMVLI